MQTHNHQERQVSRQHQSVEPIQSMHDVFADPCRRAILHYLQERENPAGVREVAGSIEACRERTREADTARAELLHRHVLTMAEFGLLSYDPATDEISLPEDVCVTVEPPYEGL